MDVIKSSFVLIFAFSNILLHQLTFGVVRP